MAVCIVKITKQGKLESKSLEGDKFTFGRALENSVVLQHESISRNHLEMATKNGKIYLKDMGSSNGTYLNGKKFKSGEIKEYLPGDMLKLGNSDISIQIEIKSEEAPKIPGPKLEVDVPQFNLNQATSPAPQPFKSAPPPVPQPTPVVLSNAPEAVKKAEEAARLAVAAVHEEARASLESAKLKAHKELDEARKEAEKIQAQAQQEASKIIQEAKLSAHEMEKTSQLQMQQSKESAEKILTLKKQEADEEKAELLKKWEKQHKELQADIEACAKKLEESKSQLMHSELTERDAKDRVKKLEANVKALEDSVKQKEIFIQEKETQLTQMKAFVADFERQLADLKKKKEEGLLEIKSLETKAKSNAELIEKEFIHQKERIKVEMAEIRQREMADVRKLRLDELDHLDKLQHQAIADIRKNQNHFTRGLSAKLEARFLKLIQNQSGEDYKILKDGIYNSVLESFDEQIFDSGQGFEKDIRLEVKVATQSRQKGLKRALGLSVAAVMAVAGIFVFQGGDLWKTLQGINDAGLTAAEQYSRKMYSQRVENKFMPEMKPGLKDSYVQNVLYTPFYVEKSQSSEVREKWIKLLNKFLTRDLALEDDSVVQLVAIESTLVSRLKAERDQINPEYLQVSVKKMEKLEQESMGKIRKIFKTQAQYDKYSQFSKKFWRQEVDSREPASGP